MEATAILDAYCGRGTIVARARAERTALHTLYATSPLRLLTPRNHGRAAWVVAAALGGGLLDGDAIDLRVDVGEGAWLALATQSSTKVYRSSTSGATQSLVADVARGGALVALPDAVVPFAGSRYAQRSTIRLASGASLVWLDGVTCGRRLSDERWRLARYASRTDVEREGELVLRDHTLLDPAHGSLAARMGDHGALATLVVLGPAFVDLTRSILAQRVAPARALVVSASPLRDGVVVRAAGSCAQIVASAMASLLARLAASLGDDPWSRRW